jgi:hypothetical protein
MERLQLPGLLDSWSPGGGILGDTQPSEEHPAEPLTLEQLWALSKAFGTGAAHSMADKVGYFGSVSQNYLPQSMNSPWIRPPTAQELRAYLPEEPQGQRAAYQAGYHAPEALALGGGGWALKKQIAKAERLARKAKREED